MSKPQSVERKPSPERLAFAATQAQPRPELRDSEMQTEEPAKDAFGSIDPGADSAWTELQPECDLPGCSFLLYAIGAIVWNAIVWGGIIVEQIRLLNKPANLIAPNQPRPDRNSYEFFCMSFGVLFWCFFALVGLWLTFLAIGYGLRWIMLRKTGLPKVEVSVHRFVPGTSFRLKVGKIARGRLRRLRIRLMCREYVLLKGIESDSEWTEEIIAGEFSRGRALPVETSGSIPQLAMPSFSVEDPEVGSASLSWFLVVSGRILGVIPYWVKYPIVVHPVATR